MSTTSISQGLQSATLVLRNISESPELDAEILLAHALKKPREFLHAWPEKNLSLEEEKQLQNFIARRLAGEPIGYILGQREFWSLDFFVTPDVLIPRPETELLVELTLKLLPNEPDIQVADLGTGSGAIALALASERPQWTIYATDESSKALEIAKKNAQKFALKNVIFHQGYWCAALPSIKFDAIVSNPPYLAEADPHLQKSVKDFEPRVALIAEENGLAALREIIQAAVKHLKSGGYLLLEHGFEQADAVTELLHNAGFIETLTHSDLANLPRATQAQFMDYTK